MALNRTLKELIVRLSAVVALLVVFNPFAVISSDAMAAGVLRVGVQLEPPNLDPTSGAAAAIDEIVYANVFEGLTRISEDGAPAPALAHSWSVSADGRQYDFYLRNNVRFHDGTVFTAEDVVFTFDRARAKGSANAQRSIFQSIDQIIPVASNHVRFRLKEPLGAFPTYLGWGDAVIVAPESADQNAIRPIGTGPFKFERWRKGASVSLTRNDDYWGAYPALDGVEFIFIPDPTAAFSALMSGDVDGFPNYPAPENLFFIKRDDRFRILYGTGEGEIIVAINNGRPPFNDIRVRRALNHAIDKKALIDTAFFGYGEPIGSHFPPHHQAYTDLTGRYEYDPDKARRLLTEAGFPDGFETTLVLPPPAYARRGGEVIAAQLAEIGVRVKIHNLEWAQWLEQVFANKSYNLSIVSHTEPLDIDIYARDDYYFQYRNDEFKTLINALRRESDPAMRMAILQRAQVMISNDAVNIFLASGPKIAVWSNDVTGVWRNAPLQANDFTGADVIGRAPSANQQNSSSTVPAGFLLALLITCAYGFLAYWVNASRAYLLERLVSMTASLFAASVVIFVLLEVAPGDPAQYMMGLNADPASIAALRAELGLDQSALVRYFNWIGGVIRGDLGLSYTYRTPVAELIGERFWVSLPLAIIAFVLSTVIAIPAGVAAAAWRRNAKGRAIITAAQAGVAIPNFWLAILLVMIFSVSLRWFSAGGFPGWQAGFFPAMKALTLPAIALALPQAAILTQIMRSSTIETLHHDYIRTARAKGLSYNAVLHKHALRNALIPALTILGLQFAFLLAGAVIIENVFYLPGLGRLALQAISQRDLMVVKGVVLILVFAVILCAFFIDLAYAAVDPRLRQPKSIKKLPQKTGNEA